MALLTPIQNHKSLYRQLVEGFYDALLVTDPNGHLLDINSRAAAFFQRSAEELRDQHVSAVMPGLTPGVFERIRANLDSDRRILIDLPCRRRDGSFFAGEVAVSQIDLMNKGDFVFCVRNVERRRRQWQLFRSGSNAFNTQLSAGFVCDEERMFRLVNPAFLALFGFAADDEVVGTRFDDVFADEALRGYFDTALGGSPAEGQVSIESGAGGSAVLEIRFEPDRQQTGKIFGVTGSMIQIG